jgi:hypothetical protein
MDEHVNNNINNNVIMIILLFDKIDDNLDNDIVFLQEEDDVETFIVDNTTHNDSCSGTNPPKNDKKIWRKAVVST